MNIIRVIKGGRKVRLESKSQTGVEKSDWSRKARQRWRDRLESKSQFGDRKVRQQVEM
jgi:hypothetical protein